ncbi:hypothetical protein BGW36DRAFT_359597 [Talaromyces proteolyticus]|uniref:RBR-type E3 ubiquitin transferase n=1 Tax=Talaromyces proteolyticus TaxID=1131652 RepID=A0AAD4KQ41_9EURO|nr:uncharacterized protein BGW36DRAFT_359597 [Talaromyces proteolyticus]KAH8697822.1 hypothetical protein BGW36DRAFT_359597 [Talaromyces proteolyticus]
MDRASAILVRNILLDEIQELRTTLENGVIDFRIALETFREEIEDLASGNIEIYDTDEDNFLDIDTNISNSQKNSNSDLALVAFDCVACQETCTMFDILRLPCSHQYCEDCVLKMIRLSLDQNTVFPPQCCGMELSITLIKEPKHEDLARRFREKLIETNDENRTYCAIRACSQYILPTNIRGNSGNCSTCKGRTCIKCKRPFHLGKCVDAEDKLIELAMSHRWKACCRCGVVIERIDGCLHMRLVKS